MNILDRSCLLSAIFCMHVLGFVEACNLEKMVMKITVNLKMRWGMKMCNMWPRVVVLMVMETLTLGSEPPSLAILLQQSQISLKTYLQALWKNVSSSLPGAEYNEQSPNLFNIFGDCQDRTSSRGLFRCNFNIYTVCHLGMWNCWIFVCWGEGNSTNNNLSTEFKPSLVPLHNIIQTCNSV